MSFNEAPGLETDTYIIAGHARKCVQAFRKAKTLPFDELLGSKRSNVANLDFQSDYEQFRVWAKNFGVFARDTASADSRLRYVWDVRKGICNLLDALHRDVLQCIELVQPAKEVSRPGDTASSAETSSDETSDEDGELSIASYLCFLLENVSDLVEKLIKISTAIRKSGLRARNLRADTWEDRDEKELDSTMTFQNYFRIVLEKRYGLNDPLLSRLCSAVSRQRHRLKYWRKHQQLLSFGDDTEQISHEQQLRISSRPSSETSGLQTETQKHSKTTQSYVTRQTKFTEATGYTKKELATELSMPSVSKSRISSSSYALIATIPKPPQVEPGIKNFQCPYCCILLPREKAESMAKWKSHVISDLCPFICVDTSCKATTVQFETENEWLQHHQRYHAQEWWCDGLFPPHEPQRFHEVEKFVAHVRMLHDFNYSEAQIQTLIQVSEISGGDPFQECPFCDASSPGIQSLSTQYNGTPQKWHGHIAKHLVDLFATFALPPRADLDDQTSERLSNTVTRSTIAQLDGFGQDINADLAIPEIVIEDPDDMIMEDSRDFEYQWDFVPRQQPPDPDPVLDNFRAYLEKARVDAEYLGLQDLFFDALVRTDDNKRGFFPRTAFSTLVTEDRVYKELKRTLRESHDASQIQTYTKSICEEIPLPEEENGSRPPKIKSLKKIFVILVLIEKAPSIVNFLYEGINDLDLPLLKHTKGKNGARFDLRLSRSPDDTLECFRNWTQHKIGSFEEWQWSAISPFFHKGLYKDVQHFPLQDSVMLPFTRDTRRDKTGHSEIESGFSRVFEVEIHQDHHNFDLSKSQNQCFAIKRLNSPNTADFKKDIEMLKLFSHDTHPHLISLLATYEQFGMFYLIIPWADGDLYRFWKVLKQKPDFDMKTVKWFARQCEGIASGLLKIHKYQTSDADSENSSHEHRYGRHGDLKPENILWFSDDDGGILKISDFGLSEYSTIHSKSDEPSRKIAPSMSYRPPECDLKGGKIGQSYDIWTLGCLYLDFVTWLLGGWVLVKEFERERLSFDPMWYDIRTDTFFELVEGNTSRGTRAIAAMLKPAVTDFMHHLHAHPSCTEFLHDFINIVALDMLLVKPNDPTEPGRLSSQQIHHALSRILRKGEDPHYLCSPAPWLISSPYTPVAIEIDMTDSEVEDMRRKGLRLYEGPLREISLKQPAVVGMNSSSNP